MVEDLRKLRPVHALSGHPVGDRPRRGQRLAVDVDGLEHLGVQAFDEVHGLQRVVQALHGHEGRAEGHRHAAQHGATGLALVPVFQQRLEVEAVDARVGKELDHLDLACRRFHGHGFAQAHVFGALFGSDPLGQGRQAGAGGEQGQGEIAAKHETALQGLNQRLGRAKRGKFPRRLSAARAPGPTRPR